MYDSQEINISNCEREPIHLLGRIQSFGLLLCFNADWTLTAASENVSDFFDASAQSLIGQPIERLFSESVKIKIRRAIVGLEHSDDSERLLNLEVIPGKGKMDVAVHISGDDLIVELEPSQVTEKASFQTLRRIHQEVALAQDFNELIARAARHMSLITGYDRVMVYRFHADQSGEVIAEQRNIDVESYLGLRYPASDIPAQARALYLRNLTRVIADVNDPGVPIRSGQRTLDLSISTLRTVSPIHLEYLQNMGVQATMSVSIRIDGKLWGLFACHNYSPYVPSLQQRSVAEVYAETLALEIRSRMFEEERIASEQARQLHLRLVTSLETSVSLFDNLVVHAQKMHQLIPSDSMVLVVAGEFHVSGDPVSSEDIQLLIQQLNQSESRGIFAVDCLSDWLYERLTLADRYAGMLVVPLSRRPRDMLIYLRKEQAQTVNWAGNPEKPVELGPNGIRLTPRKSFEAWKEIRRGYSEPWTRSELFLAEQVKSVLLEVIVRNLDEYKRVVSSAQQQKDVLIHELNHRVRNILGLMSSIVSQTSSVSGDVNEYKSMLGGRIQSLAVAQSKLTEKNWSYAPLRTIIETEVEAIATLPARVRSSGPEIDLTPKAFTTLTLVIHELLTNAVKYGALKSSSGSVQIDWKIGTAGSLEFHWQELGVTIEAPPTHRGFGSVIISRSVPHDLGGDARIEYQRTGLLATFSIPPDHFRLSDDLPVDNASTGVTEFPSAPTPNTDKVLILEDNMIIAFDIEQVLASLGYQNIVLAASVSEALKVIEQGKPCLAVLDINLGTDNSEPVGRELLALSVPFIFATGYNEQGSLFQRLFPKVPFVEKPFDKSDIANAIRQAEQSV
ncbi:GAF domain-containing protein [Thiohalocapsa marina]|uniref:histidine kinase n=1 Tax=Thiohalocapsa marina TaxID=424902 RepID=A0A5M8FLQ3_9GAMM|nr:HWE histidine kinase domain-containing protein [Thiohalocapsa marina]KAA6181842.1 GAF domain-containing protein [Thiohalocapsa marina]